MSWKDFTIKRDCLSIVAPYLGRGQSSISRDGRKWSLIHKPDTPGWFRFNTEGAYASVDAEEPFPDESWRHHPSSWADPFDTIVSGDRVLGTDARAFLSPPGPTLRTMRVAPMRVDARYGERTPLPAVVYVGEGAYDPVVEEVSNAFDEERDISGIKGVPLALRDAFHEAVADRELQREMAERARAAARVAEVIAQRHALNASFEERARQALRMAQAEILGWQPSPVDGEAVVRYRIGDERLACVVRCDTLSIVEAGICLTDHAGTTGDRLLTLESLPGVVMEAVRTHRLHVWRRA